MVSKSERRRRLERERWERREQRRAESAHRARSRRRLALKIGAAMSGLALLATGAIWLYDAAGDPSTAAGPETANPGGVCTYTDTGESAGRPVDAPPVDPGDMQGNWVASMQLGGEPVTIALLAEQAPCTVNSLRYLAEHDYLDQTQCHRLTTGESLKVLQCGDPTATGSGGPGYQFATENTAGATYQAGTVAMARSSDPNSNGSQFFLVYDDSTLPPDYTVFGEITSGMDALKAIASKGTANGVPDGPPKDKVTLDDLTVTQG